MRKSIFVLDMVEWWKFRTVVAFIMIGCSVVIIVGLPILSTLLTQHDPLPPIGPAAQVPGTEIVPVSAGSLIFTIEPEIYTYTSHSGAKGVNVRLDVTVNNVGNTTVNDLCFHKMTVYWEEGEANFTSRFGSSSNYTIVSNQTSEIELRNTDHWEEIPRYLTHYSAYGYARILITFNANESYILTTALVFIGNLTE